MTVRQLQCVTLTCNGKQASRRATIWNLSLLQITGHAMHDDLYKPCECAEPLSRTTVLQLGHWNKKCAMKVCCNAYAVPNTLFVCFVNTEETEQMNRTTGADTNMPFSWNHELHYKCAHASLIQEASFSFAFFFLQFFHKLQLPNFSVLHSAVTQFVHIYIGAYRSIGTILSFCAVQLEAESPP